MIKLEINPLDQKDIIELLDYAKEQKNLNKPVLRGSQRWDDTKYWNYRIEYLKKVILGKVIYKTQVYKSSMGYDNPQETKDE
jgi:hypothetical protein